MYDLSKLKHAICPERDNMSVEKSPMTFIAVPLGTECDDCHMAYLTARGRLDTVNFSTDIPSLQDGKSCPLQPHIAVHGHFRALRTKRSNPGTGDGLDCFTSFAMTGKDNAQKYPAGSIIISNSSLCNVKRTKYNICMA
ncbi:MAG: hypothetical protein LBJ47_06320, partial [Tannerella sp.]|nr:hypothetical protein [Tannerella sp.]